MKFKMKKDKPLPFAACVGVGAFAGLILTVILTGICAGMLLNGTIPETALGAIRGVISVASALAGCITAGLLAKGKWIPVVLASAGGYLMLLLAANAIFFGGIYDGALEVVVGVLVASVAAVLVFLLITKAGSKGISKYGFR